jgi:antitoxin (DNA-binding transcriptional repressor) of toxin-antitoxin stability system
MTQRLPTALARKDFANVLRDSAAGERIKLTRYNKTIAVIVPTKDLADLEDCQKRRALDASSESPSSEEPARSHAPKDHGSKAHGSKAHSSKDHSSKAHKTNAK